MKRRGFFGRLFGAVATAVVAPSVKVDAAPTEVETLVVKPAQGAFRPTVGPDRLPTFREAYAAALRGEVWVDPADVQAVKLATDQEIVSGDVAHHPAFVPRKREPKKPNPPQSLAYYERQKRAVEAREQWKAQQLERATRRGYAPNKRLRKEFAKIDQERRSLDRWKADALPS